jgi:hypothetical protein
MNSSVARSVFVVTRPAFAVAYNRTGGALWNCGSWDSMVEFRSDFVANGAYAWERAIGDYANALQFTPVTGGAGGTYDGVPILTEYHSSGYPNLAFLINNVAVTLTPSTMYGTPTGASTAQLSTALIGYQGSISECLVYDYDLTTNAAEYAKTIAYLRTRYPSLGL